MDEVAPRTIDGFFDGELLDGRRGLVPSNFVEKLIGEDLIEFHQSVVMGLRDGDESMSTSVPQDLDFISQDDSQMLIDIALNQTRQNAYTNYLDLEDIIEEEEEPLTEHVPPPVQLTLERQLNKSIVIGWNPPPDAAPGSIESYHVYVNGLLKTTVKSTDRTRALVEGVDSTRLHRISVRSVTPNRRTSRDAACTMIIGKDAPVGPTSVKASSISSTSAVISWLPSNSNFQHTVCVNNVEVRTVKPGVYRHTITGLSPNTTYRVTIRAKNLRAPQFDEKASRNQDRLSTTIEFRTLPKGLPDPPVDVQVEQGPQDGSLLVTWLPVTINNMGGTSNGAPVTGYAVYADGKKVTEVESPTGDHALIDLTKIPGFEPKQVTVRTKSRESVSADSVPSQIPTFGRGRGRGKFHDDDLLQSDIDRPSELSDIAEESETEISDDNVDDSDMHGDPQRNQTSGPAGVMRGLFGGRGQRTGPPGSRVDHLGQTILDHEDNMSDKEIYPHGQSGTQQQQHHQQGTGNIPSIEITKDPASESHDVYPEDEYDMGPAGRGRYDSRGPPRSHLERGRPPAPPHATHGRPLPRDARNPVDPRDPHYRDPRDRRDPRDPRHPNERYEDGRHREYGRDGYREGGPGGRGGRGEHTRIFVALFDYDPPTMSPNPDACDEELGFREGQLIKVFGDKDPDGFYWGEASGRSGYVPCNMVSEVQVDDDRVAQELLKESDAGRRKRDGSIGRRVHQGDRWGDIYANMPVRKMIAMYDYDPQELSPNVDSEVELSFQTGDIIYVYGDMDDDGFYMGELRGQRGLVPSNFLQDAPQDYNDDHRSRRDNLDPRERMMNQRGPGPGAHGPPPPPRPDQRDRRKGGLLGNLLSGPMDMVESASKATSDMASKATGGIVPATGGQPNSNVDTGAQGMGNAESEAPKGLFSSFMSGAKATMNKATSVIPVDVVTKANTSEPGQDQVKSDEKDTRALGDQRGPGVVGAPHNAQERGGRSLSRDRAGNPGAGATNPASKLNGLDLREEDQGPAISSADLDQLMMDFDLDEPQDVAAAAAAATAATSATTTTTTTTTTTGTTESKPAGLAGALPGGLGSLGSSIPNPLGEGSVLGTVGGLLTNNPVGDSLSKGKSFLFGKFGL
ncbi:unnamed protein product [Meganyctiphanes norvegica]|uniref:RIMS-binding protein 2 n=1 Tax=Meganyctiphanes norvegica TaxID=48144 RepID=A0AAV2PIZ4_MEGNR